MILNLFSSRPDHPLGDPKELKRVLAELPLDNAFKSVDEVYGWFESLQAIGEFRLDQYFDVVRQLDEAGQQHIRRLAREYLVAPRLSKSEERRLWSICYNYWGEVASLYARCLDRVRQSPKEKGSELVKPSLPLIAARLLAARTSQLKWVQLRYEPIGEDLWRGLGQPFLAAEVAGYASKPVHLYPTMGGNTTVAQQYLQALVFSASSVDCLMPLEIELADKLIAHFLPGFVFSASCALDSVYWVDAAGGTAPVRMAQQPTQSAPTQRFFAAGSVPQAVRELMRVVERGEVPADLNLGGEYSAKVVLPVLRHLAAYWGGETPQREHPRHSVKTRICVLHGFDDCFAVFAGDVARLGMERSAESWVVDNVSLGGFGASVDDHAAEWLKIGSLLGMQPEGGNNWVLGVVKRFARESEERASVGIKTLSRQAVSVELRPRTTGFSATGAVPGIWLREGSHEGTEAGETRVVLPTGSFMVRENVEFEHEGRRYLLTPMELLESGRSFEIGRYREQMLD